MRRIHLDTDIGGDSDDLCALAMLLGDPEVEIVGITTCADWHGVRASFVRHALKLAGRTDIPVASGAARFLGGQPHVPEPQDARYWPGAIIEAELRPSVDALDLMLRNAADGATVIGIGPFTNLALADTLRPGVLRDVVVMGGYTGPPPEGFPQWPASYDYNVQSDWIAARIVFERINPLIVPLNACLPVTLRTSDLPALRAGGPLSKLVALQGELQGAGSSSHETARDYPGWPPDMLNVHWDPVACAAALGWDCVRIEMALTELIRDPDGCLRFESNLRGSLRRLATHVDPEAFTNEWLARVTKV